ncbi:MAG: MMPL family transporter [Rhodococcus sp. (in: high G+C Gram-positive bacteria)]|jgi:putative drug exporter of the RND superfamily
MPTRFVTRRPGLTLAVAAVVFLVLAAIAAGTMNALSLNRFEATDAPSVAAEKILAEDFSTGTPNVAVLLTAIDGDVTADAVVDEGLRLTEIVRNSPGMGSAWSYWTESVPTLADEDGASALILGWAPGDATQVRQNVLPSLEEALGEFDARSVDLALGGSDQVFRAVAEQSRTDFLRAELIIAPLVMVLLWFVLRRMRLAAVVFATGLFSVVGTLAILRLVAAFTEVSTFAANIALVMGIALGVDYGLFLVYRFREEVRRESNNAIAASRAVRAAGHTIIFSGATVAASLSVLLVFPFPFLASFAYAGIAVVVTAVAASTLVLPAALVLLGNSALRRDSAVGNAAGSTAWRRVAEVTTGRPVIFAIVGIVVLVLLGAPALGIRFGAPDDRILPQSAPVRALYDTVREDYASEDADAVLLVAPEASRDEIRNYAIEVAALPQVLRVDGPGGSVDGSAEWAPLPESSTRFDSVSGFGGYLSIVPTRESLSDREGFVGAVRGAVPATVLLGGSPATLEDYSAGVVARLPLVAALIALITYVILFVMTGSVLAPLKATILNLLSLTVMFGALVWGFQDGNLSGLLGFTPTGSIEPSIPILMFCIAYGLSMDYEVFLLARIKEAYDRAGDNRQSIVFGISQSAPVVTAAALILAVSFATYATSGVTFLQQLGVGMAVAVLVDATIIRSVLVPSLMQLAGRWNWWAPGPLARLHRRIPRSVRTSEVNGEIPSGGDWARTGRSRV